MAYLALYRKWRPRTFDEVVGQRHISIPLKRAIEQDRLAHAYLFSGPRGTGKTSMAKILAKAVNCLHPEGVNPCNTCQNCKEITAGSSMDVYEIDAASNRGIEEIRALKESVRTLPSTCRKKVYIIDEVHMLTKEAFNALLKTLEEPPSYVLFILATTEPEKIPLTILSRCQRYEFHRISVEDIKKHLLHIAKVSQLPLTEDAADLIAVRADGGLRDALSLLDQCSSASESTTLDAAEVYGLLGLTGKDQIISLSHHIFQNESNETLLLFYDILQSGKEPAAILRDLLEHFRNIMICKINPSAPELTAYGKNLSILRQDASQLSEPYLDALFGYLHQALSETKRSSSPRMSAEMGLLHLCRIKGSQALDSLVERVTQLEAEIQSLKEGRGLLDRVTASKHYTPTFTPPAVPVVTTPSASTPMASPVSLSKDRSPVEDTALTDIPPVEEIPKNPREIAAPIKPTPSPISQDKNNVGSPQEERAAEEGPVEADLIPPESYPSLWKQVLSYFMSIHRIDVFTCLQKCVLTYCTQKRAIISAPQPFLVLAGNNKAYQKVASEAFEKVIGSPVMVHAVLKGSDEEADALTLLKTSIASGSTNKSQRKEASSKSAIPNPPPSDGYRPIRADQIADSDKNEPSLKEALKILPDCDIYEKD